MAELSLASEKFITILDYVKPVLDKLAQEQSGQTTTLKTSTYSARRVVEILCSARKKADLAICIAGKSYSHVVLNDMETSMLEWAMMQVDQRRSA